MPHAAELAPGVATISGEPLPRPNFYAENGYCTTEVPRGVMRNRAGTRMIALTTDFLLGLRRALTDECGPAADTIFKSCGRKWGILFARRFEKELGDYYGLPLRDFTMAMFLSCLSEAFSHNGFGRLTLDLDHQHQGLLIAEVRQAIMAGLVGQAEQPADAMMAGVFVGFFSQLSGETLDCVQTTCAACGSDASRFVIGLSERLTAVPGWVEAGKSHADIVAALAEVRA